MNQAYYQQVYQDWIRYRSKNRQWRPLAIGLVLLTAVTFSMMTWFKIIPLIYWGISIMFWGLFSYELYDYFNHKRQWMKQLMDNQLLNKTVAMIFTDEAIFSESPLSKTEMQWNIFRMVVPTPDGIFLIPQNGIQIYLPKYAFREEGDFEQIRERLLDNTKFDE